MSEKKTKVVRKEATNNLSIIAVVKLLGTEVIGNKILSPFKNEKTASCHLYEETNTFYCFATKTSGDIVDLIAAIKNITKAKARTELAKIRKELKVDLKQHAPTKPKYHVWEEEKEMYDYYWEKANNNPLQTEEEKTRYVSWMLICDREKIQHSVFPKFKEYCDQAGFSKRTLTYLFSEERKFTNESIKKFGIFYIRNVTKTIKWLQANFTKYELEVSGLFKKDYFIFSKNRLIFPYYSGSQIIYLTGRYAGKTANMPKGTKKYVGLINTSMNLSRKRIYNVNVLKKKTVDNKIVIVEGEPDSVIGAQWGLETIGIPGVGNFPDEYIPLLKQKDIYICFDNDESGNKASDELAKKLNVNLTKVKIKNRNDLTEIYKKNRSFYKNENIEFEKIICSNNKLLSLYDLSIMNIPPVEFIVKDFLVHGYTLLSGNSKVGKSIFAAQLALAISTGFPFAMKFHNEEKSGVLMMAYEDNNSSLKDRLNKMVPYSYTKKHPKNVFWKSISEDIPKLEEGGIELIKESLDENDEIKVIIIDTYNSARSFGGTSSGYNMREDQQFGNQLQKIALERKVSIIMIHHFNKTNHSHAPNKVSGTMGMQGSADTIILLDEPKDGIYTLNIRGRQIEQRTYAMEFDKKRMKWRVLGDAKVNEVSHSQKDIVKLFRNKSENILTTVEIAEMTKRLTSSISRDLTELVDKKILTKTSRGSYKLRTYELD